MPCFTYKNKKYNYCNFCNQSISINKQYIYLIKGPGKHNDKIICNHCFKNKIINSFRKKYK